jgi:hypothetical protein
MRLVIDAIDAPVAAPDGERLYPMLAERYGLDEDYVRQCMNELETAGVVYVERVGIEVVAYDVHPAHLRRVSEVWSPTEMLAALAGAADSAHVLTRERYESFPSESRPPADLVAVTFRSWDRAVAAAGLSGASPGGSRSGDELGDVRP